MISVSHKPVENVQIWKTTILILDNIMGVLKMIKILYQFIIASPKYKTDQKEIYDTLNKYFTSNDAESAILIYNLLFHKKNLSFHSHKWHKVQWFSRSLSWLAYISIEYTGKIYLHELLY